MVELFTNIPVKRIQLLVTSTGVAITRLPVSEPPPTEMLPRWTKTFAPETAPTKGSGKLRMPAAVPDVLSPWELMSGKV